MTTANKKEKQGVVFILSHQMVRWAHFQPKREREGEGEKERERERELIPLRVLSTDNASEKKKL